MSDKYKVIDHQLSGAGWTPSEHCAPRPPWCEVELIVIHCISLPEGQYGTGLPERLFLGTLDCAEHESFADLEGVEVSPHLFIDRRGNVQQFVKFDQQAWHAGVSQWCGRSSCNQFSVGIELEGSIQDVYTDVQTRALVAVLWALLETYPNLSVNQIVGHQDIAPDRKFDPGPFFDWKRVLEALTAL